MQVQLMVPSTVLLPITVDHVGADAPLVPLLVHCWMLPLESMITAPMIPTSALAVVLGAQECGGPRFSQTCAPSAVPVPNCNDQFGGALPEAAALIRASWTLPLESIST